MNDKKERVYSEQDLCEYTILQKIEELERQLQNLKSETSTLYETKEDASTAHTIISDNIASVDNDLQVHIEENVREFRNINNTINNLNNIIPNDIGVKDNKLGLKNGNTWLTNLNAMNLEGFTYDANTNTLKAEGGGSLTFPYIINDKSITLFKVSNYNTSVRIVEGSNDSPLVYKEMDIPKDMTSNNKMWAHVLYLSTGYRKTAIGLGTKGGHTWNVLLTTENECASGTYFLPYINNEKVKLLCNKDINIHNISLISGENTLYFSLLSSNNSSVSSLDELNTLIGATNRKINCSGTMLLQGNNYVAIHTIDYKGALVGSDLLYTDYNNGEDFGTFGSTFNASTMTITDTITSI